MSAKAIAKRTHMHHHRAKLAVTRDDETICTAAARFHEPKSTLHGYVNRRKTGARNNSRRASSDEEERTVLESILYFADHSVPLTRLHVCEAIAMMVSTFKEERQRSLPSLNGRPDTAFLRSFEKRHKSAQRVAIPEYHEAKRHAAANTEMLTSHIAEF